MAVNDSQAESKNTPLSSGCPPISCGYVSFHSNYVELNAEWQTSFHSCIFISCFACRGEDGRPSDEHFKTHLSLHFFSFFPPVPLCFSPAVLPSHLQPLLVCFCQFFFSPSPPLFLTWRARAVTRASHEATMLPNAFLRRTCASAIDWLLISVSVTFLLTL